MGQLRRLGASLDYRRERFTMDEALRARGHALLRPPPREAASSTAATGSSTGARGCASAISDLEVNHVEVDDTLYTIRYPLADG